MADNCPDQHSAHVYCFRKHVEHQVRVAQEGRRQFFIDSVWREDMTPTQAEEVGAAEAIGIADLSLSVSLNSLRWSLAQAVLWVAWRDPDRVQEQWRRLHVWSGSLWCDPPGEHQVESFEQAEAHLWAALEAGRVQATGLPWRASKPVRIEALDWSNLIWMPDKERLSVRYFGQPDPAFVCVDVLVANMLAVWPVSKVHTDAPATEGLPSDVQAPEVTTVAQPKKRGGGRPTIHDWAGAAAFVGWYLGENDYPEIEEVLVKEVERWFGAKAPGRREIQDWVSSVYAHRRKSSGA